MRIFGTDSTRRGCFAAFTTDIGGGKGSILEVRDKDGGVIELPASADFSFPLLVTNVTITQSERAHFLRCFNDRIYTYAFGTDIGKVTIDFLGFLVSGKVSGAAGGPGGGFSNITDTFLSSYKNARLSASLKFATLSLAGSSQLKGLITNMGSATSNVETNIQSFSITLTTVEVQGPDAPPVVAAPGAGAGSPGVGGVGASGPTPTAPSSGHTTTGLGSGGSDGFGADDGFSTSATPGFS